jgi:hypothetical protein
VKDVDEKPGIFGPSAFQGRDTKWRTENGERAELEESLMFSLDASVSTSKRLHPKAQQLC